MAGCAVAIHAVYLGMLAWRQPYVDLTDVRAKRMTLLDKQSIFLEAVQIITVVLGLVSTAAPGSGTFVTVVALLLWTMAVVGAALPAVIARTENTLEKRQQRQPVTTSL